ncbi:MAG: hypothetical protein ACOYJG_00690 [Prevotella sp.]
MGKDFVVIFAVFLGKSVETTAWGNIYKDDLLKRFDWGIGTKVGLEIHSHDTITLGYEHGFGKMNKADTGESNRANTYLLGFGYRF